MLEQRHSNLLSSQSFLALGDFLGFIILPALDREKATLGIKEDQNFAGL
jgi:hypothetical protein